MPQKLAISSSGESATSKQSPGPYTVQNAARELKKKTVSPT